MAVEITALQRQRIDTAANWAAENPVLLDGEIGYERDTSKLKIGDGSTAWNLLAYTPWSGVNSYPFVDADIAANAGINKAKIAGTAIVANDVATVNNAMLAGDIDVAKLTEGTARQLLQVNAAGTVVEWTDDIDIPGRLDVTGIAVFDDNVTVQGDLTVTGTTTTIDSQNLLVEDKNIEMGVVTTPTDITADGGGITLRGGTNKTINWVNSVDSWTSSEHVNLLNGKEFKIDGIKVLDAVSLGTGITGSSLTSVGTIATGVWQGSAIDVAYLDSTVVTTADSGTVTGTMIVDGTIQNVDINANAGIVDTKLDTISTSGKVSNSATTATNLNTVNAIVARDASGNFSAGTITADLTGNADTATTLDSARTFQVTGDVTGSVSSDLASGASIATSIAAGVIVDADINAAAAIADTKLDTISTAGKVSNSATTATDVNTASTIVSRDASGDFSAGTITADLTGNADTATTANTAGALSSARNFAVTGDITGTVSSDLTSGASIATSIAAGVIVDADINAAAGIADTKLGTISTAGKVDNSATTATDANTASAIVARDASGNFSAGTITADLTGNADTATSATSSTTAGALSSARTFEVTGDVTGSVSSDLTSGASIATSIAAGAIVDADVNASAAIAGTKIDPDFGSQDVITLGNVGIGRSSPAAPLHVQDNTGTTGQTLQQWTADLGTNTRAAYFIAPEVDSLGDPFIFATNNSWQFRVDATDALIINDGGNVGIGTSSPENKLDVAGTISVDRPSDYWNDHGVIVFGAGNDGPIGEIGHHGGYELCFTSNGYRNDSTQWTSHGVNSQTGAAQIALNPAGVIKFRTNSNLATGGDYNINEVMRITEDGDVGIGTSSPGEKLEVVATSPIIKSRATGNSSGKLALDSNRAASVIGGQILAQWNGNTVSRIDFVNGADGTNKDDGEIAFGTSAANATPVERMRIDSSGNVGIGTTSPGSELEIAGSANTALRIRDSNNGSYSEIAYNDNGSSTSALTIGADPGNTSVAASDIRFNVDGSEKIRIDSNGSLLVGVSAGTSFDDGAGFTQDPLFQVTTESNTDSALVLQYNSGAGAANRRFTFGFYRTADGTSVSNNSCLGDLLWLGERCRWN